MEQIAFELDDVFRWLETVLARSGDVANVKPVISHLLDRLSNEIGRFRREQLGET
jgi:hypothetical protein